MRHVDDLPIPSHMTSLEKVSFLSDRKLLKKKQKTKTLPDLLSLIGQGRTKGDTLTLGSVTLYNCQKGGGGGQPCSSLSFRNVTTLATHLFIMNNPHSAVFPSSLCIHTDLLPQPAGRQPWGRGGGFLNTVACWGSALGFCKAPTDNFHCNRHCVNKVLV